MFTGEIQRSRSRAPLYIGLVVVLAIAATVLLLPMPRTLKTTYKLLPSATSELIAPRGGTVTELVSGDGQWVEKGAVIAKFDVAEPQQKVTELGAALEAAQTKAQGASTKAAKQAQTAVVNAEAAAQAAKSALEQATAAAMGKKTFALAAAEKKAEATAGALQKAKEAAGPSAADLEAEVKRLGDALAAAKAEVASPTLVAPSAGELSGLTLKPGQAIVPGTKLGVLNDTTKLKAIIAAPMKGALQAGYTAELKLGAEVSRLKIEAVSGGSAEVVVENANHELKSGATGAANITGEQRSILSSLF